MPMQNAVHGAQVVSGTLEGWRIKTNTLEYASTNADHVTETFRVRPRLANAFVAFTAATGAILSDFNVTSVTRNAAGDYTVTMTSAMASINYAVLATAQYSNAVDIPIGEKSVPARTTTSFRIRSIAGATNEPLIISVAVFGG